MAWIHIYTAIAKSLARHGVIDSDEVKRADDAALDNMSQALGCPREMGQALGQPRDMVALQIGGK